MIYIIYHVLYYIIYLVIFFLLYYLILKLYLKYLCVRFIMLIINILIKYYVIYLVYLYNCSYVFYYQFNINTKRTPKKKKKNENNIAQKPNNNIILTHTNVQNNLYVYLAINQTEAILMKNFISICMITFFTTKHFHCSIVGSKRSNLMNCDGHVYILRNI